MDDHSNLQGRWILGACDLCGLLPEGAVSKITALGFLGLNKG